MRLKYYNLEPDEIDLVLNLSFIVKYLGLTDTEDTE